MDGNDERHGATLRHGAVAFVGREREVDELRAGLEGAVAGRGSLYVVAGDPGVGKTALADAIATEAAMRGATVLWGSAWEGGGAPAYWPWVRIIRKLVAERDLSRAIEALGSDAAARIRRLVPELPHAGAEAAGAVADHGPPDSETARFALFDAVTSLLKAAAADGLLVLVVDDLHGADQPSLLLLDFLAGELRDAPILVIGTYREAEARLHEHLAPVLTRLISKGRRLPLRGLRPDDIAELVERIAAERPPEHVLRAITQATEGNPFFVAEVVRLLSAEGSLADVARGGVRIPEGVRETIRARLEPLPDTVTDLLSIAAVVGREFQLQTLQRVSELSEEQLDGALAEALAAGVLVPRTTGLGHYGFSHGLIRETLYTDLRPQRRSRLHLAAGLALEELYAADLEPHLAELAHHFFEAAATGELSRAIEYCVRAGDRAMTLVAYEEAAGHYERALQAFGLEERADVPRRCDLLLALGTAQSRAGETQVARETFQRAAGLARKLDSAERLAQAALGYGAGLGGFEFGRVDESLVALLQEARSALGDRDSSLLARVLGRLATELYFSDRTHERAELSEHALAMARRVSEPHALASAMGARYLALWGPENADERLRIAADVVALAEEVGDRQLALRGHVWKMAALIELGDLAAADNELGRHARLAEEIKDPLHLWYVPLFRAMRALLDGRLDEAEEASAEALAIGQRLQPQNAATMNLVQLFALREEQGRSAELERSLEQFANRYPAAPVWRSGLALVLAQRGRLDEARREFEQLAAGHLAELPRDGEWLAGVAMMARVCSLLGDIERAGELADLLAPHAGRAIIAGRGAICLGPADRYAGVAAACAGRLDTAVEHFERALALALRWGAEPTTAAIRGELADALDLRGAPDDGRRSRELREAARPAASVKPATARVSAHAFYLRGDIWTIAGDDRAFQLKDSKGLHYVARMLGAPHVEFHALDLVGGPGPRTETTGDAGPLLDPEAKRAYRTRVGELEEEIDEAEAFNDPERAARAREELEFVVKELAGAVGLGGRDRRAASDTERARVNVTRAIRSALDRIADNDADLGRRLTKAVRTGTFCVYEPDPRDEGDWDFEGPA